MPADSRAVPGLVQGYAGPNNPFGGKDEMITLLLTKGAAPAIVDKAQFSDPNVVDYMTGTLLRRRELILRA